MDPARGERGEFVNAGIVLSQAISSACLQRASSSTTLALTALHEDVDLELVRKTLAAIPAVCLGGAEAGDIGKLSARERFHWLVSPKSTIVQMSPVHTGQCTDIEAALEHLMNRMIRR